MIKKGKMVEFLQNTLKINKSMKGPTICILTSGTGSRLKNYTKNRNKSLLSIKKKSILTRILNNFPKNSKFVISIGYKSQQVKDFIKIHHPELNVKFIKIHNFSGKNSGPAFSLFKCKKYLQTPFFFVSCDTIWSKKIFNYQSFNWMGSFKSNKLKNSKYCNLITRGNKILNIIDKKKIKNVKNLSIFVGLAFIKDYKTFWNGFDFKKKGEPQVSMGFQNILKNDKILNKLDIDWEDAGTKKNYEDLVIKYEKYNFNKSDQQIYISDSRVTKFFEDKQTIKNLYKKSKVKKKIFPQNIRIKKNFISYSFVNGKTFYQISNLKDFKSLIFYLEKNLWNDKFKITKNFKNNCKKFYHKKTYERVNQFLLKNKSIDKKNFEYKNIKLLRVKKILKSLNWDLLYDGLPKFIHGDLQFDNIIKLSKDNFKLIDWRPSFGNSIIIGDIHYDFAKLLGGLLINYDLIKQNRFNLKLNKKKITLNIPKRLNTKSLIDYLENYLIHKKFNLTKIKIIAGIIFLNMSPLHHHPFDKLLFLYGKYYLQKNLKLNENNC